MANPLTYIVPSDTHQIGDVGHVGDHDHIADDLTMIGNALPVVTGGLTGATAATRFAGGTTSGAPATGTFAAGDFVVDETGVIWICTTAGTPGAWANAGSSSGVSSFHSRTGVVVPGNADYLAVASGGLTGATAATRFAGGTTSGPPQSGTFAVGDYVVDHNGVTWACITADTPGSWTGSFTGLAPSNDATGATDTTNIQGLLNLGAPALLQYGVFYTDAPISVPGGGILAGTGAQVTSYWGDTGTGTIIKTVAAFSGTEAIYLPDTSHGNTSGPVIRNIAIDGVSTTATTVHGINAFGPVIEVLLENVTINKMTGWGIMTSTDASATITWPFEWHVRRVFVGYCAEGGISLTSMTDSTWEDVYVLECGGNPETGTATGPGWYVAWAGNSHFTNCRSEWSGTYGYHLTGTWFTGTGAGGCAFTNCSTDRSNYDGMKIDATGAGPIVLTGFQARRDGCNGSSGGGSYAGVNIASATVPVIINGISVFPGINDDGTGTNSPEYGLSVTSATAVSVESGYIQAATTAINNGGGNSIFWVGPAVITALGTPASPGTYANQTGYGYQTFTGQVFASAGIEVYGAVAQHITGTDTSGGATESAPTFVTTTARQCSTASDVMLYVNVKTAASLAILLGPTSTPANTVVASETAALGLITIRVPKSWYVEITGTIADLGIIQVTC